MRLKRFQSHWHHHFNWPHVAPDSKRPVAQSDKKEQQEIYLIFQLWCVENRGKTKVKIPTKNSTFLSRKWYYGENCCHIFQTKYQFAIFGCVSFFIFPAQFFENDMEEIKGWTRNTFDDIL
jgi:hypothetical protein